MSASGVGDGAGDVGLADAGGAGDGEVEGFVDPGAVGEFGEKALVEVAVAGVVDVFDGGVDAEPSLAEAVLEASVGAGGGFSVE